MFVKSVFGEKEDLKEEEVVLFSDGYEDDVCCICDKVIKLEEKEVFCVDCPNISHHSCLKNNIVGVFEPVVGKIKTFRCTKCTNKRKLLTRDECIQAGVALPNIDKRYENKREERGPNKDRRCTDVIGIVLFCLTIGAFVSLILCLGGVSSIGNGTDSCGNVCGQVNKYPPESLREKHGCMGADHTDKNFVMFVDYIIHLSDITTSPRECVSACPKNMVQILSYCLHFGTPNEPASLDSIQDQHFSSSIEDSYENSPSVESKLRNEEDLDMKGWENGNWDTIPTPKIHTFGEAMKHLFHLRAMKWVTLVNLFKVWTLAIVMSYIIVVIFCCFPQTAIWIVPITMIITFTMACAYFTMLIFEGVVNAISCFMAFILLSLLLLNLLKLRGNWNKIWKQVKVMGVFYKEASRLLSYVPGVLLLSILTMILSFSIVIVWFRVAFWIESSNVIYSPFSHSGASIQTTARWLWIFLSIWVIELTINIQKMIIAGTAAHWYFAKNKKNFSYGPVVKSIWVTFRYHLGTLLLGSIIFYPLTFIKHLVKAIFRRNKITLRDLKKLKLLFTEFWLKFVPDVLVFWFNISSTFTFHLIALRGKSFCESEQRVLDLFLNHFSHANNVVKYSAIFPAMVKIYATVLTVLASIYLFDWTGGLECRKSDNVNFALVICIIVLLSTVTGQYFLTSLQMVVDAVFVCYCEDIDSRNEIKAELIKALSKENCSQKLLEEDLTSVKSESPPIASKKLTQTSQLGSKKTSAKEIKV